MAVKRQYRIGHQGLNNPDKYSFNKILLQLLAQNGDYIRAWLATVLIGRGYYQEKKRN